MSNELLIAQVTSVSDDGHGYFRVHGPARALAQVAGVTVVECDPYHRGLPWLIDNADVLILHGVNSDFIPIAQRRRSRGQATVFEACDDYLDIQPWTDYSARWLDRTLQDQFWQLIAAVDAVQTSSDELAARWAPAARRVFVFTNHLETIPDLPPARSAGPLTIGWSGSVTHLPDWLEIAPTVVRWMMSHPGVRLAVMADEAARTYVRLPPERYQFQPRGDLAAYNRFLAQLDVAIVPLLPSPFNRGRTDSKFLELAARGVVGIYANFGPYSQEIEDGRTGLLYGDRDELIAHLDALAGDAERRLSIRKEAHARLAGRKLADHVGARLAAYRELLGDAERKTTLPEQLRSEAQSDGRHLRLFTGDALETFRTLRERPADETTVRALEQLLAAYPDYHAAARHLGRLLNDAGRFADAESRLVPATVACPESPGALIELARSRFGQGDRAASRRLLERVLIVHPGHATAWEQLLRLADAQREGLALSNRACRNQPRNYMAALAALKFAAQDEVHRWLAAWLDDFGTGLHPEERPYAAAAFGSAIASLLDLALDPPATAALLQSACRCFPDSPRLADRYGDALRAAGRADDALAEYERALRLARVALATTLEDCADPERLRLWRVAEYVRRNRGETT